MPVEKASGEEGHAILGTVEVSITTWSLTISSDLQSTTGSDNFDAVEGVLWKTNAKGAYSGEGTIEGHYDLNATTGTANLVVAALLDKAETPIVLGLTRTLDYGYGYFHLSEVEVSLEIEGELTFSATITLQGAFRPGSPPTGFGIAA